MLSVYAGSVARIWHVCPTSTPLRSAHLGGAADAPAALVNASVAVATATTAAEIEVGMRI